MPQIMSQIWDAKSPRPCCRMNGKGGKKREKYGARSAPDNVVGWKEREGRGEEGEEGKLCSIARRQRNQLGLRGSTHTARGGV